MSQAFAHALHGTPAPASPFSLAQGRDDTALFVDARIAFSHLLPGRPALGMMRPDEPADAVIHLQDAPVTIRYRLESPSFAAATASELAYGTAERYAAWRAAAGHPRPHPPAVVDFANATWLASWGVEAGAVASYLAAPAASRAREDLFVLVKNGLVLHVAWTYPAGFVEDPAYATFASTAEATMVWDPARFEQRGRVWPESAFVGPGLYGAPFPKHNEAARRAGLAPLAPDERAHVLAILSSVVSGAGAPWVILPRDVLLGNQRAILGATRDPAVQAFVDAAFRDVRTAHDLRGLAILLGRALDGTLRSSPP